MNKLLQITYRDLKSYICGQGFDFGPIFFILLSLSIFHISLADNNTAITIEMVWLITMLSFIINLGALFKDDFSDGTIYQYILYGVSAKTIIFSKIIFYYLVVVIPNIIASLSFYFITMGYFNIDLLISLIVCTIGITSIGVLVSLCNVNSRNNSIIYLLLMPFTIPFILLGINFARGEGLYNLLITLGLGMIFWPMSCYLGALLINEK